MWEAAAIDQSPRTGSAVPGTGTTPQPRSFLGHWAAHGDHGKPRSTGSSDFIREQACFTCSGQCESRDRMKCLQKPRSRKSGMITPRKGHLDLGRSLTSWLELPADTGTESHAGAGLEGKGLWSLPAGHSPRADPPRARAAHALSHCEGPRRAEARGCPCGLARKRLVRSSSCVSCLISAEKKGQNIPVLHQTQAPALAGVAQLPGCRPVHPTLHVSLPVRAHA